MSYIADREEKLHKFFARKFGLPIGKLHKLLRSKKIKVNNRIFKKNLIIYPNDQIIIKYELESNKKKQQLGQYIDAEVLYDNPSFQIINKKAGIACQGGKYLANRNYSAYYKKHNLFPVHRLDFYTSGLLIYAKNHQSCKEIGDLFQSRKIEKYYIAYINNTNNWFTYIQNYSHYGKFSASYVMPISKNFAIIKILTGRKHQVRFHMKLLKQSLISDSIYKSTGKQSQYNKMIYLNFQNLEEYIEKLDQLIKNNPIKPLLEQDQIINISIVKLINNQKIYTNYYLLHHILCKFNNQKFINIPNWQ